MKRLFMMAVFGVEPDTSIRDKLIITGIRVVLTCAIVLLFILVHILMH